MAVAQLVERTIPTPDVRGLNPTINKFKVYCQLIEKKKIKKMRPGMVHLKKTSFISYRKLPSMIFSALKRTRQAQNEYILLVPRVCKVYYRNFFLKFESDDGE